jgi:hypothetical protein
MRAMSTFVLAWVLLLFSLLNTLVLYRLLR